MGFEEIVKQEFAVAPVHRLRTAMEVFKEDAALLNCIYSNILLTKNTELAQLKMVIEIMENAIEKADTADNRQKDRNVGQKISEWTDGLVDVRKKRDEVQEEVTKIEEKIDAIVRVWNL